MHREILRSTRRLDADGTEVVEEEWAATPGWSATPHAEPDAELRYEVLDGRAHVSVEGAGRTYRAGESVIVGIGLVHTVEPAPGSGLRVRVERRISPVIEPQPTSESESPCP